MYNQENKHRKLDPGNDTVVVKSILIVLVSIALVVVASIMAIPEQNSNQTVENTEIDHEKLNEAVNQIEKISKDLDIELIIQDAKKPVIYLYPEEETQISINIETNNKLTCTYPKYSNGWEVTAYPDGLLIDSQGKQYNYLYWEGISEYSDIKTGYCIAGENSAEFLETKLEELGLTRQEANEFIVYWLPQLECNNYNIISFDTTEYCSNWPLEIEPKPDNLIRVFMTFKPSAEYIDIEANSIIPIDRGNLTGFTVVEWGGTKLGD